MRELHGGRRVLRWLRNILLGIVALGVLLVAAVFVVFETAWGREQLRARLEARLAETFVGGVRIGGVDGNPLTELVLTDVAIAGPDGAPAIAVRRLTIEVPLLPLISRQLRVDTLIAEQLDVRVARTPDGRINVANLTEPGPPSSSRWSVELPDVIVRDGHVRVELGSEPTDIDDIELHVNAALPFDEPTDAAVALSARWRQRATPLELAASLHVDDAQVILRTLAAQVGDIDVHGVDLRYARGPFATPVAGTLVVYAPAHAVRQIAPGVELPGDVALTVTAQPDGRLTHVIAKGGLVGQVALSLRATADVQARLASGTVSVASDELGALTGGRIAGRGDAVAELHVDASERGELPVVQATIRADATLRDAPAVHAEVEVTTRGERLHASVDATNAAGLRAALDAELVRRGGALVLEHGRLTARTREVYRATGGRSPAHGSLVADLEVSGTLAPRLDLALRGHARGRHLRVAGFAADAFRLRIDGKHLPSRPVGSARLELEELVRGEVELGRLTVTARNQPDGKVQVALRSRPKRAPWLVDVDALVTPGDTIIVDLQRHLVRAAGGAIWRGAGGRLTIAPERIALESFASTSRDGSIRADAAYVRAGRRAGDLRARVDAALALDSVSDTYRGRVRAHVDITRRAGTLAGRIDATAKGVTLGPEQLVLDAEATLRARADQLIAELRVRDAAADRAQLSLDIDPPEDVTDISSWRRLGRDAVRHARIALDVDLARAARYVPVPAVAGQLLARIELTPIGVSGRVAIRNAVLTETRELGRIDADLAIAQATVDEISTTLAARLRPVPPAQPVREATKDGIARVLVEARFVPPARVFDPAAWRELDAQAFRGATVRAERFAFQPGTLERFGIVSDLRGELAVAAEIDPALAAARFAVNLYELRGGVLARPITVNARGAIDDEARLLATLHADNVTLARITSQLPISLAALRDPGALRALPLDVTATLAHVPARTLMTVLGTTQILGGTLDGRIRVLGTMARPTITANLAASGVTVPHESGEPMQQLELLVLDASWDGEAATIAVDGWQSEGGVLRLRAAGSPRDLDAVTAAIYARKVDLAPLAAFLPGPVGALGGRMEARFAMRGLDPSTADLAGSLHVRDARIPITPQVGTLFEADLRVQVQRHMLGINLRGKLGRGTVTLVGNAPLKGLTPARGKLRLTLDDVQLIIASQPILTGAVTADVVRSGDIWQSRMRIEGMTVRVPDDGGDSLAPVGAPDDLVYGGERRHHGETKGRDALQRPRHDEERFVRRQGMPKNPVLDARIAIRDVQVESETMRGLLGGNLRVQLGDDGQLGAIGQVGLSRAALDLFGRRYQVETADVQFDGSLDPALDVRITYEFPEVTTITEVRGRMSDPQLALSSDPGIYSEAQLLGFLLGGEPDGDPERSVSASERAAGVGASILANQISGYVRRALPINIDVLRYEAATSTGSAAITVGTWLTDTLFFAYRRHLEARPDENTGEAEIEYWIRRRLVLEGVAGDRGVAGLDLLWRRRW